MLRWFRALLPREDRFFDLFDRHSRTIVEAANSMKALLAEEGDLQQHCARIIELEDEADEVTREVLLAVRRSFITPFDRGDIKDLIQSMDDAIDMMRKTVKTIKLFQQTNFDPRMKEMGGLIVEAAELIAEAIPLLNRVGVHSTRLSAIAEQVVRIEDLSDDLHDEGLQSLFQRYGKTDPMAYMIGSEIFGELEKVVDRFEDVADEISGIVIENV